MDPILEKNIPPVMPVKAERLSSQISKLILSEIQSGQLTVGDKLPPEIALAQRYGVSRTILREAIEMCIRDRMVVLSPDPPYPHIIVGLV